MMLQKKSVHFQKKEQQMTMEKYPHGKPAHQFWMLSLLAMFLKHHVDLKFLRIAMVL